MDSRASAREMWSGVGRERTQIVMCRVVRGRMAVGGMVGWSERMVEERAGIVVASEGTEWRGMLRKWVGLGRGAAVDMMLCCMRAVAVYGFING